MDVFNKHAHTYPDISPSSRKVLKYKDFLNLLSSPDFSQSDLIYLSKLSTSALPALDLFRFLFAITDSNGKGYIDYQDFLSLSQNILISSKDGINSNHLDLDLDLSKLLFLMVKFYENSIDNIKSNNNQNLLNSKLKISTFLNLVENYNPDDLLIIKSLLSSNSNSELDFKTFNSIIKQLPDRKFNHIFNSLSSNSSTKTISASQLTQIAQSIFYNKLPIQMESHLQQFVQDHYGNSITYDQAISIINLLRDLPKLNFLTCQKIQNDHIENYLTAKSLHNFINQNHENLNPNLSSISEDEIILYFDWNKFTYEQIKANPSLNPNNLLAILTDDLVVTQNTSSSNKSFLQFIQSIHSFLLGSLAGMIGATIVYPIDIVKTRMQNQLGNTVYSSYLDCFKKLLKNEGILGIYSGLLPQIIGVAPEKAIKLTVNDLVRGIATSNSNNDSISLKWEILAGSTAGLCQVIVTNPLEVSKIRLQTQGEKIGAEALSALQVVRLLGIRGLYKGSVACLLRDIPFSSIYFPAYANIKKYLFNYDPNLPGYKKSLEPWELLCSGALAGMPAAFLTTPSDVIKTKIQSGGTYSGVSATFRRILAEEGPRAFFKGGIARVCRSSPQFGFTLAAYEMFQKTLPLNMFYDSGEKSSNNKSELRELGFPTATDISANSDKFKLSSSANSADLNPTLLSLANYYKAFQDSQGKSGSSSSSSNSE